LAGGDIAGVQGTGRNIQITGRLAWREVLGSDAYSRAAIDVDRATVNVQGGIDAAVRYGCLPAYKVAAADADGDWRLRLWGTTKIKLGVDL
jgi:hypothetical protein